MRNFFRQINVLNLLLVAAVFFAFTHEFRPGFQADTGTREKPAMLPAAVQNALANGSIVNGTEDTDSISAYSIIGGQNLFHPDRQIPVDKPASAVIQPPPKPVLVLHGTLITDNLSLAFIEVKSNSGAPGQPYHPYFYNGRPQPQSQQNQNAKVGTYTKGDSIDGFSITSIEPDKVVLARGTETMEVYLSTPVKDFSGPNQPPYQSRFIPPGAPRPLFH